MSQGAERGKGERIAAARKIRRLTQPQLAEAAAISVSLLRKIEQGRRPCSVAVWSSISRALGLKDGSADEMRSASYAVSAAIPEIRCAIDCYDIPDPGPVALIPDLHAATELATARRLDAQYSSLADSLPALLTELTRAVHNYTGHDQEIAFGLLALAYRAADALCDKFAYPDLSARAIDLIRWAAGRSGDSLLAGMAAYVRAEMFFANLRPAAGLQALAAASGSLGIDGSRAALAIYGSLHMRSGVLAASAGLDEAASSHLAEARDVARYVPDAAYRGTAFGPSSVRIHEVAAAAEMGESKVVLRKAAAWQPPLAVPAERRSHFFIELARAQLWAGQRDEALTSLLAASKIAPQHTRHSPRARETARTLIGLQRQPGDALLRFGRWAGVGS
jgi:DNA-binding XRE family transcriptional regulator